jgi:DNA-binding NtrC family response regulator
MIKQSTHSDLLLVTNAPESIQAELEQLGYRVLVCRDCTGALRALLGRRFDVAVIDLDCPNEMDFLRKLRSCDSALQTVVLSGGWDPDHSRAMETATGVDCVRKPIQPLELQRMIAKSARITRLTRENLQLRQLVSRNESWSATSSTPPSALRPEVISHMAKPVPMVGSDADLDTISRAHVLSVLEQHNGNKARTARALGINRRSLYRLLDKYATSSLQSV